MTTSRFWVGVKGKTQEIFPDDEEGCSREHAKILRRDLLNKGYLQENVVIIGVYEEETCHTSTLKDERITTKK